MKNSPPPLPAEQDDTEVESALPVRLRQERERLGINARQMAEIGGVSRASQSLYEAGTRVPDTRYLMAAAQHGVDVHFLVTGERAAALAERNFDWVLHDAIFTAVEEWLAAERLELPAAKKMQVLKILYEYMHERNGFDHARMVELLRVAA